MAEKRNSVSSFGVNIGICVVPGPVYMPARGQGIMYAAASIAGDMVKAALVLS